MNRFPEHPLTADAAKRLTFERDAAVHEMRLRNQEFTVAAPAQRPGVPPPPKPGPASKPVPKPDVLEVPKPTPADPAVLDDRLRVP